MEQVGKAYRFKTLSNDDVYIGDSKDTEFHPKVKLERWQGECFLKVLFDDSKIPKAKRSCKVEGGKVKWQTRDFELHFHPVVPRKVSMKHPQTDKALEFLQNELGGLEFEITFKKKPSTNKIALSIETQGLKFYYQPPLHPDHPTWALCSLPCYEN